MWRVMWQYGPSRMGTMTARVAPDLKGALDAKALLWKDLNAYGDPEPVFAEHPALLRTSILALPRLQADPAMDLAGYAHVFVPTQQQALTLVNRLRAEPDIAYADLQGEWQYPVKFGQSRRVQTADILLTVPVPATPDLSGEQGYLGPAPAGIDALYAWTIPGGRGTGIKVVDVENGWNFGHEDLKGNDNGVIFGPHSDNDHGTAVLGIFHGDSNAFGVTGIASQSSLSAAAVMYDFKLRKWNAAAAIKFAADRMAPGDVILLEMHAPGPNSHDADPNSQQGFIPIEYWLPEFAAIKYATGKGIHVVEAGGNGGEDLDAAIYKNAFSRATRDSGAILVGGGNSAHDAHPRSRIWWSNYGGRVDVQGWGLDIVTTGGRSLPSYHDRISSADESKCYTQSFGGTSGASPIITGAVASINGALKAAGRAALPPADMRQLLIDTGTAQTDAPTFPATQNIGPLPNLRATFSRLTIGGVA
jgi:hypothetical protein